MASTENYHPQIAYNKALKGAWDNYRAFETMLPDLFKTDADRFVLLYDRQKYGHSFGSWEEALSVGRRQFGDGNFSIQKVEALGEACSRWPQGDSRSGVVAFAV